MEKVSLSRSQEPKTHKVSFVDGLLSYSLGKIIPKL